MQADIVCEPSADIERRAARAIRVEKRTLVHVHEVSSSTNCHAHRFVAAIMPVQFPPRLHQFLNVTALG